MVVICKKCGLPDDLCACGELDKEDTRIIVRLETRRFKKTTTMIEGIDPKLGDLQRIVKELKSKFACGGTAKDGYIMLQGDHREHVKGYLVSLAFNEARHRGSVRPSFLKLNRLLQRNYLLIFSRRFCMILLIPQ